MSTTATGTELSTELPEALRAPGEELPPGIGPYQLAWRRLRRNKVALAFGGLFIVIVILCLLAPVYAHDVAHAGPNDEHADTALNQFGLPIGPTWHAKFFLGADNTGRDVAVRLLYGGRNSIQIGAEATIITILMATLLGIVAGYFRRPARPLVGRGGGRGDRAAAGGRGRDAGARDHARALRAGDQRVRRRSPRRTRSPGQDPNRALMR